MEKAQGTMELKSEKAPNQTGSSAAATFHKLYSAQELGELMNTRPLELTKMDIGFQTRWYNCEFIEEIFRHINKEPDIQMLMTLIVVRWRRQVDDRISKVSYYDPSTHSWKPYVNNLPEKLDAVFQRVKAYRKHKEEEKQMEEKWNLLFGSNEHETITSTKAILPKDIIINNTESSVDDSETNNDHKLDELPDEIKNQILIENNKLYTDFVVTMKGPVKQWIDKHNLKDWNVVRFICRLRGIVAQKCSLRTFGKILEIIGLGNQENNMKQRKDANNDCFLKDYDDPKKKQNFWQLKRDGDAIEKILKPIIDQLSA